MQKSGCAYWKFHLNHQIVKGCQPPGLTAESLLKDLVQLPLSWESQHWMLGLSFAT